MGSQGPEDEFSGAGQGTAVRPLTEPITLADKEREGPDAHRVGCHSAGSDDHLAIRPLEVDNGLSHSGEPEEDVIVLEEPKREESGPRVVRAPRVPTQKEIEAHEVAHIPHEEWCEFCMAGRARNKIHKKQKQGANERHS